MKRLDRTIGLQDLADGFLFSLKADGRSSRTIDYYGDLLRPFVGCAHGRGWPDDPRTVGTRQLREFLSWVSARVCEHSAGNGTCLVRKAKPSAAFPYFRALRRLFNWAVEESYLKSSPMATIHFKLPSAPPSNPIRGKSYRGSSQP